MAEVAEPELAAESPLSSTTRYPATAQMQHTNDGHSLPAKLPDSPLEKVVRTVTDVAELKKQTSENHDSARAFL